MAEMNSERDRERDSEKKTWFSSVKKCFVFVMMLLLLLPILEAFAS